MLTWRLPIGTIAVVEDEAVVIPNVQLSDVDGAENEGGTSTVTMEAKHGQIELNMHSNITYLKGESGELSHKKMFTGTQDAIYFILQDLVYYPDKHYSTDDVDSDMDNIVLHVDDNGNSGIGGNLTGDASVRIQAVYGVNDALGHRARCHYPVKMPCEDAPATRRHAPIQRQCDRIVSVATIDILEDELHRFVNVSVEDPDAEDTLGGVISLVLTTQHGKLGLPAAPRGCMR